MKELHIEGIANHDDPESCATAREGGGEVLAGARTGSVLSRENRQSGTPTQLSYAEGKTLRGRNREPSGGPARSETRSTCGTFSRENREIPRVLATDGVAGRAGKADGRTPAMHALGKSDRPIVPTKLPNNAGKPAAEAVEGRGLAKGNTGEQNAPRTQGRAGAHSALDRVREAAASNKGMRFTALLHHVDVDRLRTAFRALKKDAAPGVDGMTWEQYAEHLEDNLQGLHRRLHQGAYRARPSRRAYIPKADGRQRPLGIASLEDKIVQRAVVEVLNAIYETDFLGFSYGFRPGRSQHNALYALEVALHRKVSWVLDADIRGFFDAIDHEWLVKFVEHRVGDRRVLRLVQKWLSAGVMEHGEWTRSEVGSPQGATVSPLLANVYLHYVLDLWVQWWRKKQARGEVIVVRYADDFIVGFQHRIDAERFLVELRDRLAKFCLELHPGKTRLIEFGRFALRDRQRRGEVGSPETFNFLGFTHICACNRKAGRYQVQRRTMRKRMTAKLHEVKTEMQRRRELPIADQGRWLAAMLRGHYAYYGVPTNYYALDAFRSSVVRNWYRSLRRRSQRSGLDWNRMSRVVARWLPSANIVHPCPNDRFRVTTQGKSPVR
jgi:RNA-directed DNA polymerase